MHIELAGRVRIVARDRVVPERVLRGAVVRRVLAALALDRRALSRDELGDAVWGEALPKTWDTALRGAISQLRKAVADTVPGGEDIVRTAFGCYQLDPDATVDVLVAAADLDAADHALAMNEPAAARQSADRALDILGQSLLAGLDGEWLEEQRRRLEPLRHRAWLLASAAATATGDHARAVELAGAAVEHDPFAEAGHRQLMAAHSAAGDRAAASLAYRRCREILATELGVDPSDLTEAAHRRMQAPPPGVGPVGLPASLDHRLPLAGRNDALADLLEVWSAVKAGSGATTFVVGPAGVGKSRLAAEVAARAHADGAAVLHGRFDPDQLGAFGAFGEVFGQLGVAWPPPELTGGAADDRALLFDDAVRTLAAASDARPLVIVLDDVHWADRPSLALLAHLLTAGGPRVLLVGTARDDWLPPALSEALVAARTVELAPLAPDGTAALIASWAGQPAADLVAASIHEHTGGNPFFVTAVLQDLADRGGVDLASGVAGLGPLTAATSLGDLVEAAVARAGLHGPGVALAAAVLGDGFRPELLAAVLDLPVGTVVGVLERLGHARVLGRLGQDPSRFRFVHALVGDHLLERADPARVTELHRAAARALEADDAATLRHLLAARDHPTLGRAVELGLVVADELVEQGAAEEALTILGALTDWMDDAGEPSTSARASLLLALAVAESSVDRLADARLHLRAAAEIAVALGDPTVFDAPVLLLRPTTPAEHDPATAAVAAQLLALAEPGSRLAVCARCWLAVEIGAADPERAVALVTTSLEEARRLDDPAIRRLATIAWHLMARSDTDPEQRRDELEAIRALRSPVGKRSSDLTAGVFLAGDLLELGDRAGAEAVIEETARATAGFGPTHLRWIALRNLLMLRVLDGRFDEADELGVESLSIAAALPVAEAMTLPVLQQLVTRYHQGRLGELLPLIQAYDQPDAASGPLPLVRAWMEAEVGAPGAEASVDRAVALALDMPPNPTWLGLQAITIEAAVNVGHAGAAALAERLAPASGRHVVIVTLAYLGAVDRYLGLAARATGQRAKGEDLLGRALEQHRAMGAAPYVTRTEAELEGR